MSTSKYNRGPPEDKEFCDLCGEATDRPRAERLSCDDCDRDILCEDCWILDPHYIED
jgi:hypothetical protein